MKHYVFGYGSLVKGEEQIEKYVGKKTMVTYCHLLGYKRIWNVAMDNRIVIDGYKYYNDESGNRYDGFVTFLNICSSNPNDKLFGILFEVSEENLPELDKRERNYNRVDVTDLLDVPVDGKVWVYIGKNEAVERFTQGVTEGNITINLNYYNLVENAYKTLGKEALDNYFQTTIETKIEKRHLNLVRT